MPATLLTMPFERKPTAPLCAMAFITRPEKAKVGVPDMECEVLNMPRVRFSLFAATGISAFAGFPRARDARFRDWT
jgi:hypothetical protein